MDVPPAPGVKWHDGEPFTANDVGVHGQPRAAEHPQEPRRTRGPRSSASTRSPTRTRIASGVKVIDDNTIELTLDRAERQLFQRPERPVGVHRPAAHPQGHRSEGVETIEFSTTKPIGTGPYKFIKYETDQYSQFEANPDYFMGAPKIKNIFVKRAPR